MTAFLALLRRDLLVAARNSGFLLTATLTQPALVVLVFGNILPRIGLVADEFRTVMVPGLMSITMLMAGVQGVLMPLASDLSGSREIEERLLSPISAGAVAFQRIVAGGLQASLAGLIALPVMILLMHRVSGVDVHPNWLVLVPLVLLSGLLSAAFGLNLGTRVQPRFSGLLFAVVIGPMMLFGCAYYPWASLSVMGPVQYLFLLNPLVFTSEAMRLAVTPEIPHMPLPLMLVRAAGLPGALSWLDVRAGLRAPHDPVKSAAASCPGPLRRYQGRLRLPRRGVCRSSTSAALAMHACQTRAVRPPTRIEAGRWASWQRWGQARM